MDNEITNKKKKRLHVRKPDTRDRTEEKMKKYYSTPEKQERLQERIKHYRLSILDLETKLKGLEKYVLPSCLGNNCRDTS